MADGANTAYSRPSVGIENIGDVEDINFELIPPVEDCRPGIRPIEYNVLVCPALMPEKAGSLILPEESRERLAMARQVGRMISASPYAFRFEGDYLAEAAAKPGDVVWYGRYAGKEFKGADGKTYRILKDKDIGGVIE